MKNCGASDDHPQDILHKWNYESRKMITAAQLRAARGLVDWTRNELAKAANISPETVKNIEHGIFRPQEETSERIIRTFAAHGVEFTANDGVCLRKDSVIRFEGVEGFKRFMDDVYNEAQMPYSKTTGDKPVYAASVSDVGFNEFLGDYFQAHVQRMNAIKDFKMRILHRERPSNSQSEEKRRGTYREYRLRPQNDTTNVPFYVYGDKLAMLIFENGEPPKIVIISSALVAKAYREQFESMWQSAKPLN